MSFHFGLPTFPGGIHLPERKTLVAGLPIEEMPVPPRLIVSLVQGPGAPARPVVTIGQRVLRGQLLAEPGGFISTALHAPTSGTVELIGEHPHSAGLRSTAVVIAADGADEWAPGTNEPLDEGALAALRPREIIDRIRAAGLLGMGGAGFPTHVKLSSPSEGPLDFLILNGCECEPSLCADHRVMTERPLEVVAGLRLLLRAAGARRGIIAVEAGKAGVHDRLLREIRGVEGLSCRMVATKYPQGAEKQLIKALLDREVPSGGLPRDVRVLVQNVATAAAVSDAVRLARPLTERVVTVSGDGVERPANLLCRIGTTFRAILERQGVAPGARRLIAGGPMTGVAQWTADVPVLKITNGILVFCSVPAPGWTACINCGRCVETCPMHLMPGQLSKLGEYGRFGEMPAAHVQDCIECGCCSWGCPARRPIVQWIRQGKRESALAGGRLQADRGVPALPGKDGCA